MKPKVFPLLACMNISLLITGARAQLAIDWYAIGPAAGTTATVGETSSGNLTGGQFSFDAGFLTVESAPTTSPPPRLSIFGTATNTIVVSWPSPGVGWSLQEASDLTANNWTTVTTTPTDDGTNLTVVFDLSATSLYLRLKH